jgi:hypothetical protein
MSVLMTVTISRVGAAWGLFAGGALVGALLAPNWGQKWMQIGYLFWNCFNYWIFP